MSLTYDEFNRLNWRKTKYSMNGGNCVEVASTAGIVVIRDSKDPRGPLLQYSRDSWRSFLGEARLGHFDTLG